MQINKVIMLSIFFVGSFAFADNFKAIHSQELSQKLQKIEKTTNGHISMSVIDLNNFHKLSYHGDKVLPMQCTSKVIGVAIILKQSMSDRNLLNERVFYTEKDLVKWSPVTQKHIKDGMTVEELSQAAIEQSDNTAMNLLVKKAGGLSQINLFAHNDLHDESFRQDRNWPSEDLAVPGGVLDTSTLNNMVMNLYTLLFGNVINSELKNKLENWLKRSKRANNRIRSGIPDGWIVGDKTGTGLYYGMTNDLAIIWPPRCKPIILGIYYYRNDKKADKKEAVFKDITNTTLQELAKQDKCIVIK